MKYVDRVAIAVLASFVGAQITEGALLVPYWRSMSAPEFVAYYQEHAEAIGRYFTLMTIVAVAATIGATVAQFRRRAPRRHFALVATVLMGVCIAFFYIYFKGANETLVAGTMSPSEQAEALKTWSVVHWTRVAVEVAALGTLIASATTGHPVDT